MSEKQISDVTTAVDVRVAFPEREEEENGGEDDQRRALVLLLFFFAFEEEVTDGEGCLDVGVCDGTCFDCFLGGASLSEEEEEFCD